MIRVLSVFVVMYGAQVVRIPRVVMLNGVLVAAALEFLTVPLAGLLSDRFGRCPLCFGGAFFTIVASLPLFWRVQTGNHALVIVTMAVCMSLRHACYTAVPRWACRLPRRLAAG